MSWIAGVDGCRGRWVVVFRRLDDQEPARVEILETITDVFRAEPALAAVAVDMPIGLPDRIVGPGRPAEQAVRSMLGARQSSVFSIPVRAAVDAESYAEACALAAAGSTPPRKVARQGFMLFPKIRELDVALRADASMAARVVETHPEVVFRVLKGEPLAHSKKSPAGASERLALLAMAGFPADLLSRSVPRGAKLDDFIDAMACSHTAMRRAKGLAQPHPEPFSCDRHGLPVAIWT